MNKTVKYVLIGGGILAIYFYGKKKGWWKGKVKPEYTPANLPLAEEYFSKIQALYSSAPSGQSLPKEISDQVVKYMAEIEKVGYTVNDENRLVRRNYSS